MSDLITRCPNCSTAFRISETLINSAKGIVRCGSCLNVFNAQEYLVKQHSIEKKATTTIPPRRSMSKVISDLERMAKSSESIHRSATQHTSNLEADTKLKKPQILRQPQKLKKPNSENSSLFERSTEAEVIQEEEESAVDEAWALELLKEDEISTDEPEIQIRKVTSPNIPQAVEPTAPSSQENSQKPSQPKGNSTTPPPEKAKEALAATKAVEPVAHPDEAIEIEIKEVVKEEIINEAINIPIEKNSPAPAIEAAKPKMVKEPETLIDAIASIELEPLESILSDRKTSFLRRSVWTAATLIALLALIGQIGWLQFHRLNQIEPYRTVYNLACLTLKCTLPDLKDHSQINASNLLIRSHPEKDGALLVDVILKNNAVFEQAFPDLRLTFTDLTNMPVVTRKLHPKEYLGGEMTGQKMMPVKQAVHIAIEIVDPGEKAVSYNISIDD